jgi:hypothetical protein
MYYTMTVISGAERSDEPGMTEQLGMRRNI